MKIIKELNYGKEKEQIADAYLPEENGFTTVVCFHGGGLECHGKDTPNFVDIAQSFVKAGYAFVSANYRIYPQAKFPEFIRDAAMAIAYTKSKIAEWGGNGQIILSAFIFDFTRYEFTMRVLWIIVVVTIVNKGKKWDTYF